MENYSLTADVSLPMLCSVFEDAVRGTCHVHYTPGQIEAWINRATPGRWKELWESGLFFEAAVDEATNGAVGFMSVNARGYLHSLFVRPAFQRRGVASLLLAAAEDYARSCGAEELHTEASITARPFFEAKGFLVECEQEVSIGQVRLTNFVMRKPLGQLKGT